MSGGMAKRNRGSVVEDPTAPSGFRSGDHTLRATTRIRLRLESIKVYRALALSAKPHFRSEMKVSRSFVSFRRGREQEKRPKHGDERCHLAAFTGNGTGLAKRHQNC